MSVSLGNPRFRNRGFTLIELLVTLVILTILASAATPLVQLEFKRHKEESLRRALNTIRDALDAYKKASLEGHIATDPLESGYPPSLTILVAGTEDAVDPSHPKMYFLRRIPHDPFSESYGASGASEWGIRSYESEPQNPREGRDVYDVFSRSSDVGLNGIPYREW